MKPVVEIFRVGEHQTMNGQTLRFSKADVQAVADAFDPEETPVPVVIGHPKADHPAYAWAEAVTMEGGILKASLKDIDPEFARLVKAKRYKRISSAFFHPTAPNNPKPGQYSLRHIGFLGAAAPAVKGLKPAEFADGDSDWMAFAGPSAAQIERQYKTIFRLTENHRAIEKLMDQGKVMPRDKEGLLAFMATLDSSHMIAFAEGEGEEKKTRLAWFTDFLKRQPEQIEFGAYDLGDDPALSPHAQFAAPEGHSVDPDTLEIHAKATQIMKEKGVRFEDALELIHGD